MPDTASTNDHDCTVCGFTFTGSRVQIIGGKAYCADDAPTTDAQRNARTWFTILNNH